MKFAVLTVLVAATLAAPVSAADWVLISKGVDGIKPATYVDVSSIRIISNNIIQYLSKFEYQNHPNQWLSSTAIYRVNCLRRKFTVTDVDIYFTNGLRTTPAILERWQDFPSNMTPNSTMNYVCSR
jgi:hypothetical protein